MSNRARPVGSRVQYSRYSDMVGTITAAENGMYDVRWDKSLREIRGYVPSELRDPVAGAGFPVGAPVVVSMPGQPPIEGVVITEATIYTRTIVLTEAGDRVPADAVWMNAQPERTGRGRFVIDLLYPDGFTTTYARRYPTRAAADGDAARVNAGLAGKAQNMRATVREI